MSYRGSGYGIHGDVGDDDFRFGDGSEGQGQQRRGNEQREDSRGGQFFRGEGERPEARDAADAWNRRFGREGYEGSYAPHDEGYQRFRERHVAELDRDYDEWCREREHAFHRDFDDWRSQRRQVSNQPGNERQVASDRAADELAPEVSQASVTPPRARRTRR